jgi:hypothetical protein
VQYGLKALQSGAISAEEFVTLNEKIGGFDADGNRTGRVPSPTRRRCRSRTGHRVQRREPGQAADHRLAWLRRAGHPLHLALVLERARIDAAYGDHDNQVMWRYGTGLLPDGGAGGGRDGEVVPHHGRVAQQLVATALQGDAQRCAHARASRRGRFLRRSTSAS